MSEGFRLALFQVATADGRESDNEAHGLGEGKKLFILSHSLV